MLWGVGKINFNNFKVNPMYPNYVIAFYMSYKTY